MRLALVLCAASARAADATHLIWQTTDDGTPGTRDEWVTGDGQRRELVDHGRDQSLVRVRWRSSESDRS